MVVVAFGLVSMRKRRRWTVTRSVLVQLGRLVKAIRTLASPGESRSVATIGAVAGPGRFSRCV